MHKLLQHKDLKISLIFSLLGLIASICVALYQISMFSERTTQQVVSQLGSIEALISIAAVQGVLMTFFATFIGLNLARKVNLKLNFKYEKKHSYCQYLLA